MPVGCSGSARGMATEKQVLMRINATKNISKITQSMKMVSAAKLRGDQARLDTARPFNKWAENISEDPITIEEGVDTSTWPQKNLIVAVTSDRGLCGGVNSFVTRGMKKIMASLEAEGKEATLLVVGEKGRSQLARLFPTSIDRSCTDALTPMQFSMASAVTTEALKNDFDGLHIVYNVFKSAISYETSIKSLPSLTKTEEEPMVEYEFEPDTKDEVLADLYEYLLASQMYHSLMEGATSEQSSRMNAMENASKNAGEMIDSLTLIYNRARQSRITTELIEIISGASALDD
ncbi:unnamed protein product [Discosporangium mesarthrocarpum]